MGKKNNINLFIILYATVFKIITTKRISRISEVFPGVFSQILLNLLTMDTALFCSRTVKLGETL